MSNLPLDERSLLLKKLLKYLIKKKEKRDDKRNRKNKHFTLRGKMTITNHLPS